MEQKNFTIWGNMKTLIFLGAGASASDGAPLQKYLFRDYFKMIKGATGHDNMDRDLAFYFSSIFGLDCVNGNLETMVFPTFEEAIGIVDLALLRNESIKSLSSISLKGA